MAAYVVLGIEQSGFNGKPQAVPICGASNEREFSMAKITPTVGRTILFIVPNASSGIRIRPGQPLCAQIAAVNDDGTINIGYLDAIGIHAHRENVPVMEPGGTEPSGDYCKWMEYQIGVAEKEAPAIHVVPPDSVPPAPAKADKATAAKAVAKSVVRKK